MSKKRILVIDDTPEVRELLERILDLDYDIETHGTWSSAFRRMTQNDYDLILLDVNLHGFNGDDIMAILNDSGQFKLSPTKVVLFSSMDKLELEKKAIECGADGCIQKTFNERLLKHRIQKCLR